ncbi:hypothetical protein PCAR4_320069 [Paraburkholderia caribensis]|nr:hypothetical protein PCAR4_320069 [Paraburkholderia caribensis]
MITWFSQITEKAARPGNAFPVTGGP